MSYEGACLCGEIHYRTSDEPVFSANCHCTDCQQVSGSPYAPVMMFSSSGVEINGSPNYFRSTGDSGGEIERGFCGTCGSQLFVRLLAMPALLGIRPGSLKNSSLFKPAMDIYVASAQPWAHMDPDIPKVQLSPRGPDA